MKSRWFPSAAIGLIGLVLFCGCLDAILSAVDPEAAHYARLGTRTFDAFRKFSFEEEREIGIAIACQVIHSEGLLDVPEVTRYLNLVVSTVGAHSDRASINYYVAVLPTPEINAVSCPGGYIFISYGLLLALEDEAELAGVFGHEIGHICKKHVLCSIRHQKQKAALAEAVAWENQGAFNSMIDGLTQSVTGAPLSRHYEVECDRSGTVYIANAGYDPNGLVRALAKMKQYGKDARTGHYGPLDERIKEAVEYGQKHGVGQSGQILKERYQQRCIQPLLAAIAKAGMPTQPGKR